MATNFPNGLDTTVNLPNISDVAVPTLTAAVVGAQDSQITVKSTAGYVSQNGLIIIDSEQIVYTYKTNTQFLGCARGFGGTAVTAHNINATVYSTFTGAVYSNLRDAVLQLEEFIGVNGSNVAIVSKTNDFQGSQQLSQGLLLNTEANTGLDQWTFAPINNGTEAIMELLYVGSAASNKVNIPGLAISVSPHSLAFYNNISFSASLVLDMSLSPYQCVTLTADVTSSTIINAIAGQVFIIQITQDTVGGHLFTFPTNFKGNPTLDETANTSLTLFYWYDGTSAWPIGQQVPV